MNSDDVELNGRLDHAHDGEEERDTRYGWQVDGVAMPVFQHQATTFQVPRLGNLAIHDQPDLKLKQSLSTEASDLAKKI